MKERKIYKEIPGGKNSFHSAVLTTYSFNFHHFEGQVLRTLKEKWISSVNILMDQNMLNYSLGVASNYLKSINQAYAINGIKSLGAFHPKINFFIGDSCLLAIFGSGNITPGGHGKNHEIFSGFYADSNDKTDLPLLLELWEYIIGYAGQMDGYSSERICETITRCCDLFLTKKIIKHQFHYLSDDFDAALLYNEKDSSILHQLSNLIPANEIEAITIACPYYDEDGALLKNLCQLFPNSKLNIYLQEREGLPPTKINVDERIVFYDFDKTTRGKVKINSSLDRRMLHAKIFHFKSPQKEYCLMGSANATKAAMGSLDSPYRNDELCVLYASSSFDFLKYIGINKVRKPIKDISVLSRTNYYGDNAPTVYNKTKQILKSIDLEGRQLKVYVNSKHIPTEQCYLTAFREDGLECFSFPINGLEEESFKFILPSEYSSPDQLPQYCAFVNVNGDIISNKQLVNRIDKLKNTNPEKNLRYIREIISKVEVGEFNELEIADYLIQLYRENTQITQISTNNGSHKTKQEITEINIPTLSYDEAIAASSDISTLPKIVSGHITSRLWQSLEYIFESKSNAISDELMEEEEEASTTDSKARKIEEKEYSHNCIKVGNDTNRPFNIVKKLTEKYCFDLRRAQSKEEHVIGIVDYLRFLLSSHTITTICLFNEYTSFPKNTDITGWQKKIHYLYLDSILSILKEFSLLHHRRKTAKYTSNHDDLIFRHNDLLNKTLYHILLDATLAYNIQEKHNPIIKEQIILYCLNIFNKCGLPNDGLKDYIEKLSVVNGNVFHPPHVLKMLDEIIAISRNGTYKEIEKLGICKIDSIQGDRYRVNTIYSNSYSFVSKKDVNDFAL